MKTYDPYFCGEPMFFLSSPLIEAFPLLGMPKPLLHGLSLLIAFMCRRGFFPTKSPIMQTWIIHVIVHCWRLWFRANPNQTYCNPRFIRHMQAGFSHDIHRLSNYQCRAAIEARKVKEAPVLTFTNSVKFCLDVTSCYEMYS
jgi:hypothetical protein